MSDPTIFLLVFWGFIALACIVRWLWRFACDWYDVQERGW